MIHVSPSLIGHHHHHRHRLCFALEHRHPPPSRFEQEHHHDPPPPKKKNGLKLFKSSIGPMFVPTERLLLTYSQQILASKP